MNSMEPFIYYGQNREDLILSAFFPDVKRGYYVDVGACHPVKYSVTKLFYDKGWNGINIEPQEKEYKLLVKDRPRDINLNIGIAEEPGSLVLRSFDNESLSTFSDSIKEQYTNNMEDNLLYKDISVEVKPLRDVFQEYNVKKIHFLKVDVEGFEESVINSNDWKRYRPDVLCVEVNNYAHNKSWQSLLLSVDYEKVYEDGLNEYYTDKESRRSRIFKREYQKLIVSRTSLSYDWHLRITEIVEQLENVQRSLDHQIELNDSLRSELVKTNTKSLPSKMVIAPKLKKLLRKIRGRNTSTS